MRVAVIDDEKKYRNEALEYIKRFAKENNADIQADGFESGIDFASDYQSEYDIIFLDIEMPHMNGIEVAKKIRKKDRFVVIIFITTFSQYAINGYEVDAVDYVIKPVGYYVFTEKLKKGMQIVTQRREQDEFIVIREKQIVRVAVYDIVYVNSDKNYAVYHTLSGAEYRIRSTITNLRDTLPNDSFAESSAGCLLNFAHVEKIEGCNVFVNGDIFVLSRGKRRQFISKFIDFLRKGGIAKKCFR